MTQSGEQLLQSMSYEDLQGFINNVDHNIETIKKQIAAKESDLRELIRTQYEYEQHRELFEKYQKGKKP